MTTTGSGVQANDIVIADGFSWSSSSTLSLDSYQSISVSASVSVTGLASLTLTTNDGGTNGTLSFAENGNVTFANLSSNLIVNGAAYTLEGTVQTLASAIEANLNGNFAFANPYDAGGDGTYDMPPVADFGGSFEGLGNTISYLSIDSGSCYELGLFGVLEGTARDLKLSDAVVTGVCPETFNGILVGENIGTIFGCESTGSVADGQATGGLVGYSNGTIAYSRSSASVLAFFGGGLVGENTGIIIDSYATGDVKGPNYAMLGGLVGSSSGTIDTAYATGAVAGRKGAMAGGLVGYANASISNTYATGAVSVGEKAGHLRFASDSGGLIGKNEATLASSYSTGAPTGGLEATLGGSIADNEGTATDLYWDTTTSGTETGVGQGHQKGVTGLTTHRLKSGLPAGFDPSIWGEQKGINHGLPYLLAIPPK